MATTQETTAEGILSDHRGMGWDVTQFIGAPGDTTEICLNDSNDIPSRWRNLGLDELCLLIARAHIGHPYGSSVGAVAFRVRLFAWRREDADAATVHDVELPVDDVLGPDDTVHCLVCERCHQDNGVWRVNWPARLVVYPGSSKRWGCLECSHAHEIEPTP